MKYLSVKGHLIPNLLSNSFLKSIYRRENNGHRDRLVSCAPKSLQVVTAAMKLKDICSLEEKL